MPELNQPAMIPSLEKYLELASTRHKLVVTNMANVDTPGYRTRDIDFRAEFQRALDVTDSQSSPVIQTVSGLVQRPDGNDVSLDREGVALSETQLQFRIGVQLIRSEFHRWLTAINEGRQG